MSDEAIPAGCPKNIGKEGGWTKKQVKAYVKALDADRKAFWACFRKYDADGNGTLSPDEITDMLRKFGGLDGKELEVAVSNMFSTYDENKDNVIDFDEFCDWFNTAKEPSPEAADAGVVMTEEKKAEVLAETVQEIVQEEEAKAEEAPAAEADAPAAEGEAEKDELADIDLTADDLKASALKIQASFRGKQGRKSVAAKKEEAAAGAAGDDAPAEEAAADAPAADAEAPAEAPAEGAPAEEAPADPPAEE